MSTVVNPVTDVSSPPAPLVRMPTSKRPLQRLGAVRSREGITRRTVARRLKTSINDIKRQEDETTDILLSTLYQWQEVLEVPMSELLVGVEEPLSSPVKKRAELLRIMKTVVTILERTGETPIRRMAQTLVEQLIELMPELEGVSPWPAVGKSRLPSEYGQTIHRRLPDELFLGADDNE